VSDEVGERLGNLRREPPTFRRVTVQRSIDLTPRMRQITLGGPGLAGFALAEPAASVRLLVPLPGPSGLVLPAWTGNEFLLPDGLRPGIRTLTPLRFDPGTLELDVAVVLHGRGVVSPWAAAAEPGAEAAVSGPGRGYRIDEAAPAYFLAGDESALPAMGQLLASLPGTMRVTVHVEVADPEARMALHPHPAATVVWHDARPGAVPGEELVEAVRAAELAEGVGIWVAGEAAAVQRVRRHLFEERGMRRSQATVRGYWKHGRAGEVDAD
jgi:NADPH-dependent ferric siderophore reductase